MDSLQVQELQEELRTMKERGATLVDVLDHALETMDRRGTRVISSKEFEQVVNAIKRDEFCSGLIEEYDRNLLQDAEGNSRAKGEKSLFSKLRTIVLDVKMKLTHKVVVLDGIESQREIESPLQKSHRQPLEDADGKDKTYGRRRSRTWGVAAVDQSSSSSPNSRWRGDPKGLPEKKGSSKISPRFSPDRLGSSKDGLSLRMKKTGNVFFTKCCFFGESINKLCLIHRDSLQ